MGTEQIADLLERFPAATRRARRRIELRLVGDPGLSAALHVLEQEVQAETGREESKAATPAWYRAALSRFLLTPIKRKT